MSGDIYRVSLWLCQSADPVDLQWTEDEAQSTYKTVCLVFSPKMAASQDNPGRSVSQKDFISQRSAACMCGSVCVFVCMRLQLCVYLGTQQWYVWHRLCGGLSLVKFGSLHINRVVYLCVLCVSVGAARLEQHLANVFVSKTVEYRVQQRAACCRDQGGIGVQRRAGCISQQPPEGERHPAAHKHTEHQEQPREAPPTAVFACIRLVGREKVPLGSNGMGVPPCHTADSSVQLQGYHNNHQEATTQQW